MGYIDFSAAASLLSNRKFGVVPGTGANLTSRFQAMMDNAVNDGLTVSMEPGLYEVDNLLVLHNTDYNTNPLPFRRKIPSLVCPTGGATIKKRNSADNSYLLAADRWTKTNGDEAYPTSPLNLYGVTLDGAGIAQDVLVHTSQYSQIILCTITGGTRHGIYETITAKNGTPMVGGRVTARYDSNQIFGNGDTGLRVPYDGVGQPTAVISDSWFTNNLVYDNGVTNINMDQFAGWFIVNNQCYHYAVQPSAGYCARLGGGGNVGHVEGNTWTGIDGLGAGLGYCLVVDTSADFLSIGDKYHHGKGILCSFNSGAGKYVGIRGATFFGSESCITHGYNSSSCEVVSIGNVFQKSDPHAFTAGNNNGIITYDHDRISGDGTILCGRRRNGGALGGRIMEGVEYATYGSTLTSRSLQTQIFSATAGADQKVLLPASPKQGFVFNIVRFSSATGFTNLNVRDNGDTTTIATLNTAGTNVIVKYDGANWRRVLSGTN